ncbi:MAG TPA: SDR family NAD(P)-dependent oxidoreductase [Rhodobacterales bacterium]|nr:SDR family NAD(P)-dependent oxidoreductase [Rhodobacterales bacterium]
MRIVVTGANRGIGAALVDAARAAGHDVIAATRAGQGGDICFDVTNHKEAWTAAAGVGPIDALINNAGIIGPARQTPLDMDFAGLRETFEVNTFAPLAVTQAFLPNLHAGENPRILSVSSQMAWMGYAKSDRIAYRASKAALNKLMQGLATDLAPAGIPVALVDPGWVRTDMGGPEAEDDPHEVARGVLALTEALTPVMSGGFYTWRGERRAF